jgi:hypothetical protein
MEMNSIYVYKNAYFGGTKKRIGRSELQGSKFDQFLIDLIAQI